MPSDEASESSRQAWTGSSQRSSRHLEEDAFRAYLQPIGASRAKYRITSVLEKALRSYRPL